MKNNQYKALSLRQRGFTLVELLVAMAVGSLVAAAAIAIMWQMLWIVPRNTSDAAAITQVQNAATWISRDALMSQEAYGNMQTILNGDVGGSGEVTDIEVGDTSGFPPFGVISIDDEIIQYASKDDDTFIDCTRGDNPTEHGSGTPVTAFINLKWIIGRLNTDNDIEYEEHQTTYLIAGRSGDLGEQKELWRYHYLVDDGSLLDTLRVAEFIDRDSTVSEWDDISKELVVTLIAEVGEESADRTYRISPRPLSLRGSGG